MMKKIVCSTIPNGVRNAESAPIVASIFIGVEIAITSLMNTFVPFPKEEKLLFQHAATATPVKVQKGLRNG